MSSGANDVVMPQLGQAMEFGTIAEWVVDNGETVTAGQVIASVESDKATYELEAIADGVLQHVAEIGEEIPVGDLVAKIGGAVSSVASGSEAAADASAPAVAAEVSGHTVVMPQLGQAMEFGTIAEWVVADGETVSNGQVIASVESDKATYELEATADGTLHHVVDLGDEVPVGDAVATIGGAGAAPVAASSSASVASAAPTAATVSAAPAVAPVTSGPVPASPKAKHIAAEKGVDLAAITPRRADQLIVAADVENYAASAPAKAAVAKPAAAPNDGSVVPLTRLRKMAADRLGQSWQQAPHFVQMIEVDATQLVEAKQAIRDKRLACSLNDIFIKVAADTLAAFPDLNARFVEGGLAMSSSVDVGMAVATDEGLMVPVLRNVAGGSLSDLAEATVGLVERTRSGQLLPNDIGGGSLTVSNLGRYGVSFGTPVLNLGEPILVFLGALEDRPVGENGQIVLRPRTTVSVAFDHRVADGLRAAEFSQALKHKLETLEGVLTNAGASAPVAQATSTDSAQAGNPDQPLTTESREILAVSTEKLKVSVSSNKHRWAVDEPPSLGGDDSAPDPVTLALSGLASCLIVAFKLTAKKRKIEIARAEAKLKANPSGKVEEVAVELNVWSDGDPAKIEKLLKPAKKSCYVHDMLRDDLPVTVELNVHPVQ